MEQARKWFPYLIIAMLLVVTVVLTLKGCNPKEKVIYKPGKETVKHIPGIPDTVTKFVPYPVYIEKPKGDHFGKDSSIYTVHNENGRVEVTTYPATDSIQVEIEPVVIERIIHQLDSVLVTRVDTMKIYSTTTVDQPWYDTFLTGFISAVLAVAGVIGAFAL